MRRIRLLLVFVLFSVLGSGARARAEEKAPDPEALKAARELSAILSKETLSQMSAQMSSLMWPDVERKLRAKQTLSASQSTTLRQDLERIQLDFLTKLMEDAPIVYARNFTAPELREMIAFYHTPVGEKALRVLPQVTADIMALIMPRVPKLQSDVMDAFGKVLKKRGLMI